MIGQVKIRQVWLQSQTPYEGSRDTDSKTLCINHICDIFLDGFRQ